MSDSSAPPAAPLERVLALRRDPLVVRVAEAARGPCHLVGGVLRDAFLDRPCHDVDVVVSGGGRQLALDLAETLPARFVHLGGKAFAAFRLVGDGFEVDLWDRAGMSFEDDLARRDLTVNALALDLHPPAPEEPPVDLFGGLEDLAARRLRATTGRSFTDDPLRVLRLPRFRVTLPGFTADPATVELARASAAGLLEVAHERVREEVERLFATRTGVPVAEGRFAEAAVTLRDVGAAAVLVGEERAALPVERFTAFERAAAWAEKHHETVDRLAGRLALWAGEDGLAELAERGHLVRDTARRGRVVAAEVAALGASTDLDPVAARRFLHRAGSLWPTAWAASGDAVSAAGRDRFARLRKTAAAHGAVLFDPPRFLTGLDLQRDFGVPPGRRLGEILKSVRQAQVDGAVSSPEDARHHVAAWLERDEELAD